MPKINFDYLVLNALTMAEKEELAKILENNIKVQQLVSMIKSIGKEMGLLIGMKATMGLGEGCLPKDLSAADFIRSALISPLLDKKETDIGIVPKVISDTLPGIKIGDETVKVPVVEFRAPLGNGCELEGLGSVLQEQANRAKEFAQAGLVHYVNEQTVQDVKHKDKKIKNS